MGKERKQKFRNKVNPTGLPSMKDFMKKEEFLNLISSTPTDSRKLNSLFEDLLAKLQHPSEETKEAACLTLICFLNQPKATDLILERNDLIKSVICLLHDSTNRVKNAAAGLLRNASAVSPEASQNLISNDILTPLNTLFNQYGVNYVPHNDKLRTDTLLQILHIYFNLCEASAIAISRLVQGKSLQLLIRYLDASIFGEDIASAAAQCLFCISDDKAETCVLLSETSTKQLLWKILDTDDEKIDLLKILCAGIIHNMHATLNIQYGGEKESIEKIIKVLLKSISKDTKGAIKAVTQLFAEIKSEKDETELKKKNELLEVEMAKIDGMILNQRYALEILTNICSDDDKDSMQESEDEEENVADMELDSENVGNGNSAVIDEISISLQNALTRNNVSACILQQSVILPESVTTILLSHPLGTDVVKKMSSQSSQCLFCFNNIASILNVNALGGVQSVYDTWLQLAEQTFSQQVASSDGNLMEARSYVLRGLISLLHKENESEVFNFLSKSKLESMFLAYRNVIANCDMESSSRVNFVRVLGSVGTILMGKEGLHMDAAAPIIREIGKLLLDLTKTSRFPLLSEALDAIIDLFSEDYTDNIAQEINLCKHMELAHATFISQYKASKKSKEWIHPVTQTIKDNLMAFIQYKKQNIK